MENSNEKTVLILDRNTFSNESSNHQVDFEVFMKSKGPGILNIPPITKSLWTCNVEAVLEYVRIVYDLFPTDKLLQVLVNDIQPSSINTWTQASQNLQHITLGLAIKSKEYPARSSSNNPQQQHSEINGILLALKVLSTMTPQQEKMYIPNSLIDCENAKLLAVNNIGRIVYLSSYKSNEAVSVFEENVSNAIELHNQLMSNTPLSLQINDVHLILVDVVPTHVNSRCTSHAKKKISGSLTSELHCSQSGQGIFSKLVELAMEHYGLTLTTITGIPMKEEQNAFSSANYDVELLHCRDAHSELFKTGCLDSLLKSKEIYNTNAVPLKWCTPKSLVAEMQQCNGAYRITPVDVNSRPSLCLTNFLLGGRSVMLEHQNGKLNTKTMSHMLTSHAGEIFIHSLATFRSIHEDPPSISEGVGGRLTDYRIQDFGELMKRCRFVPYSNTADVSAGGGGSGSSSGDPSQSAGGSSKQQLGGQTAAAATAAGGGGGGGGGGERRLTPLDKSKEQLERMTRYWPLTISDSILTCMIGTLEPLPFLLTKETLSEADVVECLKIIYHVVGMETKNEPLPLANTGVRGGAKNVKREEQYRQVWIELEKLVRFHGDSSANHRRVLTCLLDCKKPDSKSVAKDDKGVVAVMGADNNNTTAAVVGSGVKKQLDESKVNDRTNERTKVVNDSTIPTTTTINNNNNNNNDGGGDDDDDDGGSGGSGVPKKKKFKSMIANAKPGDSLLTLWHSYLNEKTKLKPKKLPFYGESQMVNNSIELYQFMKENNNNNNGDQVTSANNNSKCSSNGNNNANKVTPME